MQVLVRTTGTSREVIRAITNLSHPLRRPQRQSEVAGGNALLSRVNADKGAFEFLDHALGGVADRGKGAARTQLNHGQLGRAPSQVGQPLGKSALLRVRAVS